MNKPPITTTKYAVSYTSVMEKENLLILELARTGTHADLFSK